MDRGRKPASSPQRSTMAAHSSREWLFLADAGAARSKNVATGPPSCAALSETAHRNRFFLPELRLHHYEDVSASGDAAG